MIIRNYEGVRGSYLSARYCLPQLLPDAGRRPEANKPLWAPAYLLQFPSWPWRWCRWALVCACTCNGLHYRDEPWARKTQIFGTAGKLEATQRETLYFPRLFIIPSCKVLLSLKREPYTKRQPGLCGPAMQSLDKPVERASQRWAKSTGVSTKNSCNSLECLYVPYSVLSILSGY